MSSNSARSREHGEQRNRPEEDPCASSRPSPRQPSSRRRRQRCRSQVCSDPVTAKRRRSCWTRRRTTRTCTRSRLRMRPDKLTIVANWIPLEDPAGGPNFGKLDPKAKYHVKIDNTGDGVEDVGYHWKFTSRFRNPESFLAYVPPVRSIDDPNINFVQTYDLCKDRYRNGQLVSAGSSATTCPSRPTTPGRRRSRTTRPSPTAPSSPIARRRQVVRRARRRSVLRRSRLDLRRREHRPARPSGHRPGQPGRREGRRRGLQHPRVRPAGPQAARHAQPAGRLRPEGRQRGRRRLGDDRAPSPAGDRPAEPRRRHDGPRPPARPAGERVEPVGAGQPPRQPAHQRGRHPARPEGQVQPDASGRRRGELRQVRRQPRARQDPERPVRPGHQGDRAGPTSCRRC